MSDRQDNNPLHGITLESLLSQLVTLYGWQGLAERLPINCFTHEPSVKSSLSFLRRTSWARQKVEALYLASQDSSLANAAAEVSDEPRKVLSRPQASGKPRGERQARQGYGTNRDPRPDGERPTSYVDRPQGERNFSRGDRPQGERNFSRGDRPQGERNFSRGDRPQGERNFNRADRPQGERNFNRADRPQGERSYNRPQGDRPQGERSYSRPQGDRPQGERGYSRPQGDRPQGDRPFNRSGERQHGREQHGHGQPRGSAGDRAPRPASPAGAAVSPWGKKKKQENE